MLLAASGGLGFASALALARENVQVCVSGSNSDRAADAARRIADDTGTTAVGLASDLSDPSNMNALLDATI